MTKNDVYQALVQNHESTTEYMDGSKWGHVYLPNVGTSHQIAGFLSVLKKDGLYKPECEYFGEVKLN